MAFQVCTHRELTVHILDADESVLRLACRVTGIQKKCDDNAVSASPRAFNGLQLI